MSRRLFTAFANHQAGWLAEWLEGKTYPETTFSSIQLLAFTLFDLELVFQISVSFSERQAEELLSNVRLDLSYLPIPDLQ